MKPGSSFWLRLIAVTSLVVFGVLSSSDAFADKLPIKEVKRQILMGEPEIPDGTIPIRTVDQVIDRSISAKDENALSPNLSWGHLERTMIARIIVFFTSTLHW